MKHKQPEQKRKKILIVGTTPDYIAWLKKSCPDRSLFLTHPEIRKRAEEPVPRADEEILSTMEDIPQVRTALQNHLKKWSQTITGIACFDCESMRLASILASDLSLSYPGIHAIDNCRNKYLSRKIWYAKDIPCPQSMPVKSMKEILFFLSQNSDGIVLKPFSGSGSELVFNCQTPKECQQAFLTIRDGLKKRASNSLFRTGNYCDYIMLAEEMIKGPEFSCDFIIDKDKITIIRLTRKIKHPSHPFGTILGYVIPSSLPPHTEMSKFKGILLESAKALGIERGICMIDFILRNDQPVLIEMTPRPGGDCLPFLLMEAGNLDILKMTLDFSENNITRKDLSFRPHIGIRLHAHKNGILKGIHTDSIMKNTGVKQIHLIRKPGHRITMPPRDYDSWLLGHIIIQVDKTQSPITQCFNIARSIDVEIESL